MSIYLMILSREIDIKMGQNYTKIHIYTILYKIIRFKQIIFSKYTTKLKLFCGISSFSDWFRICGIWSDYNITTFIQNCTYMNFRINLTQFYMNFLRQEHQIDVLYGSFNAWDSQVSSYTSFLRCHPIPPFIFPLQPL